MGGEVGDQAADSTSRDQKWRIRRDQRLGGISQYVRSMYV